MADSITVCELERRFERLIAEVPLGAEMWGTILARIIPEEYGDCGPPPVRMTALPNTAERERELTARFRQRQELFRGDDADVPDNVGVLLKGREQYDECGRKIVGNGTLAARTRNDASAEMRWEELQGEGRIDLPDVPTIRTERGPKKKDAGKQLRKLLSGIANPKSLPEKLRLARRQHGWTLGQLSKWTRLKPSTLCMYESGKRNPSEWSLKQLAKVYKTTVDVMLLSSWPVKPPKVLKD